MGAPLLQTEVKHMGNIVIQTDRLTDAVVGGLASVTAIILDSTFSTGMLQNFLLKKVRCQLVFELITAPEGIIVGYCAGDLTIAQIATIMATPELGPSEGDEGALNRKIYWETVRIVEALNPVYAIDQSLGGGKGIPTFEGVGYQMFVFNPTGGALAATVLANGVQMQYGVWM